MGCTVEGMIQQMKKVELLSPAGNLEKLKMAFAYGADAVYIGGQAFGLRAGAKNFSVEEIHEAVNYAHELDRKVYVTVNIIAHNADLPQLPPYLQALNEADVDAVLVSDPGVFEIVRETAPGMEIHLSTQANATNYRTVSFWGRQGMTRAVVARELSLNEIKKIRQKVGEEIELESFIQGAMCVSYSGRCLLSSFLTGRDANRGRCSHPCRWQYYLMESKREGEYFPVEEDSRGTHILNSKDLCMIRHIPELIKAGIKSLKIEGRMKSSFYIATVTRAYRMAIDDYYRKGEGWEFNPYWLEEIEKTSHRKFTTGFYFEDNGESTQDYSTSKYTRHYSFIGLIKEKIEKDKWRIEQRNRFFLEDEVEIISPRGVKTIFSKVKEIIDPVTTESREQAPHPQEDLIVRLEGTENIELEEKSIMRKRTDNH